LLVVAVIGPTQEANHESESRCPPPDARDGGGAPVTDSLKTSSLVLLDELLRLTFAVRDLYASARYQGADTGIPHLRPLFDTHHAQQLRLVEVLVDRIGATHGVKGVFEAGLPDTHPAYVLRGLAPERLLCDLLEAHAAVLGAADRARAKGLDPSADREFAVGRVVLTNDLQSDAVREQLAGLQM
jgi:hypothetical protein